jgi:hypothetical protein
MEKMVNCYELSENTHSVNSCCSFICWNKINLIKNNNHLVTCYFANDQTFSCLRLYTFCDVHYQHHQINDLCPCSAMKATEI